MQHPVNREAKPAAVAWAIHAFTASGAVLGFLAFLAVEQSRFRLALVWLGAALIVDGVDGPLARWAGVKERMPAIDGTTLDLVVDYVTYVFVPAVLVYRAGLFPSSLAEVGAAAILLSSLYTFARTDMKTDDNFFRGFPAVWNVVAYYLYLLQPAPAWSLGIVALFALLTFAPIHFIHPMRVERFQPWLRLLTGLWGLSSLALLLPGLGGVWLTACQVLSLGCAAVLFGFGLLRTIQGRRKSG